MFFHLGPSLWLTTSSPLVNLFGESQTSEDARFYGLSAKVAKPFSNDGKDLVVQYAVKHEQRIDCGGAYIKLLGPGVDQVRVGGVVWCGAPALPPP